MTTVDRNRMFYMTSKTAEELGVMRPCTALRRLMMFEFDKLIIRWHTLRDPVNEAIKTLIRAAYECAGIVTIPSIWVYERDAIQPYQYAEEPWIAQRLMRIAQWLGENALGLKYILDKEKYDAYFKELEAQAVTEIVATQMLAPKFEAAFANAGLNNRAIFSMPYASQIQDVIGNVEFPLGDALGTWFYRHKGVWKDEAKTIKANPAPRVLPKWLNDRALPQIDLRQVTPTSKAYKVSEASTVWYEGWLLEDTADLNNFMAYTDENDTKAVLGVE